MPKIGFSTHDHLCGCHRLKRWQQRSSPQGSAVLHKGGHFQTSRVTNEVKWFVPPLKLASLYNVRWEQVLLRGPLKVQPASTDGF